MSGETATMPTDAPAPQARSLRPSRWDRPKPPHDWRWVVGGIGRALIVTGLLMFGFVAYQLWGTGLYTAQQQSRLEDQFEDLATATLPSIATTVPGTSTPGTSTPASTPTSDPVETLPHVLVLPDKGKVLARIEAPAMGLDKYIVQGVGKSDLQAGPGHFVESVMPGQLGNAAIAGHRTTFGAVFFDIDKLQPGDPITITYPSGLSYVYAVTSTAVVKPGDYDLVVPTVDPTKATLALVSCHPPKTASKRYVVHAELISGAPDLVVVDAGGDVTGPDDVDVTETLPDETVSSEPGDVAPEPSGNGPSAIDAQIAETGQDAFASGWFSDPAAWPHVVAWGLLLAGVWVGIALVARRARRYWVGIAVGFVPFVVVLYFWYENINRLLPASI